MQSCPVKQNITLTLDRDLLRKARVMAAERGTSISKLLADELCRIVADADRYAAAKDQALQDLAKGHHLGGRPAGRDALHER